MGVPLNSEIIHFNRIFPYKLSILGYPDVWTPPTWQADVDASCNSSAVLSVPDSQS